MHKPSNWREQIGENASTNRNISTITRSKKIHRWIFLKKFLAFIQVARFSFFSGHSFRRTSASILANTGATAERVQRLGKWLNAKVANEYVEESLFYKKTTGDMITSSIASNTVTSRATVTSQRMVAVASQATAASQVMVASQGYLDNVHDDEEINYDELQGITNSIEAHVQDVSANVGHGANTSGRVREAFSNITNSGDDSMHGRKVEDFMKSSRFSFSNCEVHFHLSDSKKKIVIS